MAHIHTEPGQNDLTASGYIYRLDGDEPVVILHMHKRMHHWMHFGGHVELDENPWQTLGREILEESGYEFDQLELLQPDIPLLQTSKQSRVITHPYPVSIITAPYPDIDHAHIDISYAFVTKESPRHKTGDGESDDLRGFTRAQLLELSEGEVFVSLREAALYGFDHVLPNWKSAPAKDVR